MMKARETAEIHVSMKAEHAACGCSPASIELLQAQ